MVTATTSRIPQRAGDPAQLLQIAVEAGRRATDAYLDGLDDPRRAAATAPARHAAVTVEVACEDTVKRIVVEGKRRNVRPNQFDAGKDAPCDFEHGALGSTSPRR